MTQRTDRVDELLRQEIGADRGARGRRSADRLRDDHEGRDDAGPAARQGVGQRHRPAGRAQRDRRRAAAGDAVRPARAGQARCGSSASRTCTSSLDETAERGTRVLQLLNELGGGRGARRRPAARRDAADAGRAAAARGRRRPTSRRSAVDPAASRARRRRAGPRAAAMLGRRGGLPRPRARAPAMTIDLGAVPRRGARRRRRAVARRAARPGRRPREPRRRHARARRSAIVRIVEALGGTRRRPSAPTRRRRCTTSCRASSASGPTRIPTADYDLLVVSDCGTLDRIGEVRGRHRRAVRAAAARRHRPPRLERRRRRRPTGSSRPPRRPARWSRSWRPGSGSPLDAGRRRARHGPDGRHRHGHRDVRPPERHAADAGRRRRPWSRPARRCRTSRAGCTAPSPTAQLRLFGRVLDRLDERRRRARRSGRRCSTRTSRRPAHSPPQSEGIIDLLAQADEAEVAILFKEAGQRRGSACGRSPAASTRPC